MLQVRFLGQFDVRSDGQRIVIPSRAGQSLFAYLVLSAGTMHRREKLAGLFWPDISEEKARRYLRNELWRVRKAVQSKPDNGDAYQYLLADEYSIGFSPLAAYWLDVAAIEASEPDLDSLISNLALYHGELLPELYEEWVLLERERLRALYDARMQDLLYRLVDERRWNTVLEWSEKWIALGETPEAAYRALMVAYAATGNHARAIASYERARIALEQELGVGPSPETRGLYEQILRGETIAQVDLNAHPVLSLRHAHPEEPAAPGDPPFKGLECFEEGDDGLYFGREALVAQLVDGWTASGFLAMIVGASGSGKSSFVRAGLVPALRRANVPHAGANGNGHKSVDLYLEVLLITPTSHPLEALAIALTRDQESVTAATTLMDDLTRDPRSLYFYLDRLAKEDANGTTSGSRGRHSFGTRRPLLLVVDQLEEIFTLCRDPYEREQFIDNLLYALNQTASARSGDSLRSTSCAVAPCFHVVLTLRADFYAHLAQYAELRALFARHQEYIGPMTTDELRCAIAEPAKRQRAADGAPWQFESGLVDLLLRDVGNEPGALPLLSHALLETWKRRSGHTMTLKGYHDAGGVRGAIAQTAETVYLELDAQQQEVAREIFLRLTELGEATEDTRRRASFDELVPQGQAGIQVRSVLFKLADSRLVTLGESSAEVAHEALIREWPRLREWLNTDRDGMRLHRQLTEAAHEWELLERDPGALYRGVRLAQIREWASAAPTEHPIGDEPAQANARKMNDLERAFLAASVAHEEHEAIERAAQQQRELESARRFADTAQKLSEEKGERLKQQAHANRRLRQRTVYLAAALLLMLLLAAGAIFFAAQADRNTQAVRDQEKITTSRELAGAAMSELKVDPDRSILLALQALATADTSEAESALHRAVSSSRLILSLGGHTGGISAVDISSDGTRIATASLDGTTKIWNAATGAEIVELKGHTAPMQDIEFSRDGRRVATANRDKTARVWDAATGSELQTMRGHMNEVVGVAFKPDGTQIATSGLDGTIRVWDVTSGSQTMVIRDYTGLMGRIAYSPDGKQIAVGFDNGTTKLWASDTGRELLQFSGHEGAVSNLVFSPDGTLIATAGADNSVRIWDWDVIHSKGEQLIVLKGHSGPVTGLDFSPDGARIATSSSDGLIKLWDVASGAELVTLSGHVGAVSDVASSPDCAKPPELTFEWCGTRVVSVGDDRTTKIWDVTPSGSREVITLSGTDGMFSSDGSRLVTFTRAPGTIQGRVWKIAPFPTERAQTSAFASDLERFAVEPLQAWALSFDGAQANAVAMNPDKSLIVAIGPGNAMRVWDTRSGALGLRIFFLGGHYYLYALRAVGIRPDGERVAVGTDDHFTVRIFDSDGQPLLILAGHTDIINQVAFSPDGKRLISGSRDRTARIWDAESGSELFALGRHTSAVTSVTFSRDGRLAATGTSDGTATVWDTATGKASVSMSGHAGAIKTLAFSPDGAKLATGSQDATAKVWDTATGRELFTLSDQAREVTQVDFSPDGTRLAAGSMDGLVRLYLMNVQDLIALAKTRLTRTWTTDECKKFLHLEQCPESGYPLPNK